jgi:hypothetical protein
LTPEAHDFGIVAHASIIPSGGDFDILLCGRAPPLS